MRKNTVKDIASNRLHHIYMFILILFSLLFFWRNSIFYSYSNVGIAYENVIQRDDTSGSLLAPASGDAATVTVDEIIINIPDGLKTNINITAYAIQPDGTETIIETKSVRKHLKKISFHIDNQLMSYLRISCVDSLNGSPVALPEISIYFQDKSLNIFQNNTIYILHILYCILLSAVILAVACLSKHFLLIEQNANGAVKTYSNKKERDSNIELLRIICMFILICHHFAVHGGLLNLPISFPKHVGLIFLPMGKICFISYIAISMYYLADGKAKFSRFLRCWLEVLFYSVSLVIISWIFGGQIRIRDFISSFFVMTSNSHGFAASYLLFLLIYPFIIKVSINITKYQARYLLIVLFAMQILSQIMRTWTGYTQPVFSEVTLFVFCYVLSFNLKKWPILALQNRVLQITTVVATWLFLFLSWTASYVGSLDNKGCMIVSALAGDESGILYIISGYSLFYIFLSMKSFKNSIINKVATCTFGILLIHDHNFLRHIFWNEIIRTGNIFWTPNFAIRFFLISAGIFISCGTLDWLRQRIFEDPITNSKRFKHICNLMDKILSIE